MHLPIEAAIIDDEALARDDLRYLLRAHPEVSIVGEAGTVGEGRRLLSRITPQLLFLDIQLMGGSGFDLVPCAAPSCHIIFFTSHNKFAVRAFEVNALDYLLKPVSARRLAKSLERLEPQKSLRDPPTPVVQPLNADDHLFIRTEKEQRFVDLATISAITAQGGNYTAVCLCGGQSHLMRRTLAEWEQLLPHPPFIRIHRSHVINLHQVDRLQREENGAWQLLLRDRPDPLAVSRRAYQRLKHALNACR